MSIYGGSISNNGVLMSDGTLLTNGVLMADGVLMSDGTLMADGVLMSDGTLMADGVLMSDSAFLGDNTPGMQPNNPIYFNSSSERGRSSRLPPLLLRAESSNKNLIFKTNFQTEFAALNPDLNFSDVPTFLYILGGKIATLGVNGLPSER